jgi:hypothetical protein
MSAISFAQRYPDQASIETVPAEGGMATVTVQSADASSTTVSFIARVGQDGLPILATSPDAFTSTSTDDGGVVSRVSLDNVDADGNGSADTMSARVTINGDPAVVVLEDGKEQTLEYSSSGWKNDPVSSATIIAAISQDIAGRYIGFNGPDSPATSVPPSNIQV